jgi:hypothetical protein
MPQAIGEVLVNLDATQLPVGALGVWTNAGSIKGTFASPTAAIPNVATIDGVKGVTLNATGTAQFYTGPAAPPAVTGNGSRTIEAWIINPAIADEETIFSWGRRGGPAGSNTSFNHGGNAAFGAIGHWDAPDIGWDGKISTNIWTYVVYTYDGPSQTTTVYRDGEVANTETLGAPLNTHAVDTANAPLPFRVGSQTDAGGAATAGLRGSMTISRIRVHDAALDPAAIKAKFDEEKATFGLVDTDNDTIPDWFERRFSTALKADDATDAAKDSDSDGLTNLKEFQILTAPDKADTDGDGVSDGAEVNRTQSFVPAPTDPLRSDTDGDGLSDKAENGSGVVFDATNTGSNPLNADSDGDGFGDFQEVFSKSDPNNVASVPGPNRPPLISLDVVNQPLGSFGVWTNTGTLGGVFSSPTNAVPTVEVVQAVKGVTINRTGTAQFYTGPAAPSFVTGNNSRTIEAWIMNPARADEETIFSWGRRGGPDGSNTSFNHGLNATFGAVGQWGAGPDIGWNGQTVANTWTYVVYTYDGPSQTTTVYKDGVEANTETLGTPLNTWAVDNLGRPLPFRVGSQNEANGNATGGLRGSMTIAKIRVYDRALDPAAILANYNTEAADFGLVDFDSDGLPTWYERQYSFLNPNDASDAPKDQDSDALTNLVEFQKGTAPDKADTDFDGVPDGAEVNRMAGGAPAPTDPLNSDSDQDGLSEGAEVTAATNPLSGDTDTDGFFDGHEVFHGSNPTSATSMPNLATPAKLVDLDATGLPLGPLPVWQNTGAMGTVFQAPETGIASVESIQGVKGVTLDGSNNLYTGPSAPVFMTGNANRTVEAWIYNPASAGEETIFSWGRRGGGDGSNVSFNHGNNATFGAVGHWGAPDIGWNGASNIVVGAWTHVAYTYDGQTMTTRVYKNGVEANNEVLTAPLATWDIDNTTLGKALPFRVGSQNEANGTPTGTLRGSMTIGRIRVYDQALSAAALAAKYNEEKTFFAGAPAEIKIQGASYDSVAGSFTLTWSATASQMYAVEASANLRDWTQVANNLAGSGAGVPVGTYTDRPAAGTPARFYRIRVQ